MAEAQPAHTFPLLRNRPITELRVSPELDKISRRGAPVSPLETRAAAARIGLTHLTPPHSNLFSTPRDPYQTAGGGDVHLRLTLALPPSSHVS